METARYAIGEEDQIAFMLLHFRRSIPAFLVAGALTVVLLGTLAFVYDDGRAAMAAAIGGVLGMSAMFGYFRFLAIPKHAKRAWREFALIQEPMEFTVGTDGFEIVQPSAHVKALWSNMIRWDEDERVFAIYVTQQQAYILPKNQIEPSVIEYARQCLVESGLAAKGKKRK